MEILVHLGEVEIHIRSPTEHHTFPKENLEQHLAQTLNHYAKQGITQIGVIQGPGSFLHGRVGNLLLNTRQSLVGGKLCFATMTKPELYHWLYSQDHIPRHMMIYIGQKKNGRRYDLQDHTYTKRSYVSMADESAPYSYDGGGDMAGSPITCDRSDSGPVMVYHDKEIPLQDAPWQMTTVVAPHYGVDPTIH